MAIQTFVSGAVLTAAQMNTLQQQAVMTFTTEAARDAALTSPTEGMYAYLTAPTQPAATGATTGVPTGIRTIYNGAAWVCVTPIMATTMTEGNTSSATFTATLASGGTNPSVSVATGTVALVTISTNQYNNSTFINSCTVDISGASTIASSTVSTSFGILLTQGSDYDSVSSTFIVTGLTAGVNVFTLHYRSQSNQANFGNRSILVQGIA